MVTEIKYSGKIFEIVHEEHGTRTFEIARRAPGSRLLIFTPDSKILLTKEYREELGGYDIRVPGGKVFDTLAEYQEFLRDGSKDIIEYAKKAAKKEGVEEMGIKVEDLEHIATSRCGATVEWDLYFFAIHKYKKLPGGASPEMGEQIEVIEPFTIPEVIDMCLAGKIREERAVAVLLQYFYTKNLLKIL